MYPMTWCNSSPLNLWLLFITLHDSIQKTVVISRSWALCFFLFVNTIKSKSGHMMKRDCNSFISLWVYRSGLFKELFKYSHPIDLQCLWAICAFLLHFQVSVYTQNEQSGNTFRSFSVNRMKINTAAVLPWLHWLKLLWLIY